ncbi:MAG: tetratricopeptide repeat protein [Acidobacteria bacterium]|nr:tetratricopeptide repeat protein [Acidobacteriota bacterium]
MIAALLPMLLAFQVTPELRQHVDAGLKARAAGDLDTAVREFRRVAELAPDLAAAHVNLGAVYFEKKDYAACVAPLRRALELNPDLPGAHGMLGAALLAQGYASESIAHLEKARAEDLLGVALLEGGRVREAVDRLEAALQKRPEDADLLYYLSQAHGRLSRQLADRLRQSSPESARTQLMLGEALAAAGNREPAAKHLRAALALRPDLRGVHYVLGEMYLESGDYENAEREFGEEARMVPGSAAAAYKLGLVLLNRGQVREAIAALERANTLQPDMPETQVELGKALATAGEAAGAEKMFQRVLELEPASRLAETAHFQLAQIYRKLGRSADAEREMTLFQQLRGKRK